MANRKDQSMSVSLIAHNGTSVVTREQVFALATPEPKSRTHRVVPHAEVIAQILDELGRRSLVVAREAYSLSPDGNRLFGVLDTQDELMPSGLGIAIGISQLTRPNARVGRLCRYPCIRLRQPIVQRRGHPLPQAHQPHFGRGCNSRRH